MEDINIVVGDSDQEYVHAFSAYLMEHIPGVSIYSFTSEEVFIQSDVYFQLAILSKDFLSVLEFSQKEIAANKFYLCDENIAEEYEHLPMVYKYQSMEIVEEMIRRIIFREKRDWIGKKAGQNTKVFGIYSPISHELQMPFGFSLCQVYRERGSVLFLDIEEFSMMEALTNQQKEKTLMDLLYLVMQQDEKTLDLSEFIHSFMGVDYISPFGNPEELNDIPQEAWEKLMQVLLSAGYDTLVILFGRTIRGFRQMVSLCEELVVLGKPGDYYHKSQKSFVDYAKKAYQKTRIETVSLPMSAGNLVDGAYQMEELVQGNLGMFVRRLMQEGTIAREIRYGTA